MLGDVQASFIHNTGLLFIMTNQNTDLGCVIVSAFLLRVFDLLSVGPQHPQCTLSHLLYSSWLVRGIFNGSVLKTVSKL